MCNERARRNLEKNTLKSGYLVHSNDERPENGQLLKPIRKLLYRYSTNIFFHINLQIFKLKTFNVYKVDLGMSHIDNNCFKGIISYIKYQTSK